MVFALAGDSTMTSDLANFLYLHGLTSPLPILVQESRQSIAMADGAVSIRRTPGLVKQGGFEPSQSGRRGASRRDLASRGSRGPREPWERAARSARRARRSKGSVRS